MTSNPDVEPGAGDLEKSLTKEHEGMVRKATHTLEKKKKRFYKVFKRWKDGEESDWWFASTGIPLLAATLGPLANVSSIAALVTSWRQNNYLDGNFLADFDGITYADPRWCYWINVASLICGFLGNLFLLLNFTQRIRYAIALPATIILWYLSSGFLIAITACMDIYAPPNRPYEGCEYTQGFWYAVAAAAFYLLCSMLLMINMLGFFLGHYPDNFELSDSQRTLILQTMAFFVWLGGGAALFSRLEKSADAPGWNFADALYFCDVTILTVGFGDLAPTTDVTRGIVFPYSVGGIITLALIVSSLYKFVRELGQEKIVQKHIERMRTRAVERTVTNSFDLRQREHDARLPTDKPTAGLPGISAPVDPRPYRTAMGETVRSKPTFPRLPDALKISKKPKIMLLREEKDRFDAMRQIQADTKKFKRWMALFWSVTTFSLLWCVGAVVFWQAEQDAQGMTYFQALYFCYISLLTIGYGDMSPKSNAGRCFFVIWSLIAVPTMTILVSDLGDTVVAKFKKWSDELADFTVLPKEGTWRSFLDHHPWLLTHIQRYKTERAAKKRLRHGFDTIDPRSVVDNNNNTNTNMTTNSSQQISFSDPSTPAADPEEDADTALVTHPTLNTLAHEVDSNTTSLTSLSVRLALSIQKVSADIRLSKSKRYTYEEWVEFTRVIRLTTPARLNRVFSRNQAGSENAGGSAGSANGNEREQEVVDGDGDDNEEGLVNWDWIGDDSPMMSGVTESEWLLERLCESLVRLERRREGVLVGGIGDVVFRDMESQGPRTMPEEDSGRGDGIDGVKKCAG